MATVRGGKIKVSGPMVEIEEGGSTARSKELARSEKG